MTYRSSWLYKEGQIGRGIIVLRQVAVSGETTSRVWLQRRIAQAHALKRSNYPLSAAEEDRVLLAEEIVRLSAVVHRIAYAGEGELSLQECRKLALDSLQGKGLADADAVTVLRKLREFLKRRFEVVVAGDSVRFRFEESGPEAASLFQLLERADTVLGLWPEKVPSIG